MRNCVSLFENSTLVPFLSLLSPVSKYTNTNPYSLKYKSYTTNTQSIERLMKTTLYFVQNSSQI